jgi:fructan beta-fructosidase
MMIEAILLVCACGLPPAPDLEPVAESRRTLTIDQHYLWLPIREGAPVHRLRLEVDGKAIREFDIALEPEKPQLVAFEDLSAHKGRKLELISNLDGAAKLLDSISLRAETPDRPALTGDDTRPRYHFTAPIGWLNDPNGLVFVDGIYHLYYQHNPYGWAWGNMHWGHATSRDLLRWDHHPIALRPKSYGDWCFSGSALVDPANRSGFGGGGKPPIVAAYTSTGRGECIVYSRDEGRTFLEYSGNPVVKHAGRDPRLLWHEPSERFVMAVYDEAGGKQRIVFHSSSDLQTWREESAIDGFFECPELFELAIEGRPGESRWVLHAADGKYLLGGFDGSRFEPDFPEKHALWHGHFYASQTFSNVSDGRRIQIGWARGIDTPGATFNQRMNIPVELTLRSTTNGPRLFAVPVREIASVFEKPLRASSLTTRSESGVTHYAREEALSEQWECRLAVSRSAGEPRTELWIGGVPIVIDHDARILEVSGAPLELSSSEAPLRLRILADRGMVETFVGDGQVVLCSKRSSEPSESWIRVRNGSIDESSLSIARLKPALGP